MKPEIDFGYNDGVVKPDAPVVEEEKTDLTTGKEDNAKHDEDRDTIEEVEQKQETGEQKEDDKPSPTGQPSKEDNGLDLTEGDKIELDDQTYTVDKDGNLVDDNNNIFKKADEVKDFLKEYQASDDTTAEIDMDAVIKAVGVNITDENNKPVSFDNTPEGVAAYLNNVIDVRKNEYAEAGVNKLLEQYPFVKDIINYYNVNGSLEGIGQIQDRTSIEVDENNVNQQKQIIRDAWKEFGRRGDVEKYINYLSETGGLLDAAKDELNALKESDIAQKEQMEQQARQAEEENNARLVKYWNDVKTTIDNRTIAGYKIPETIIISKNGKNVTATPQDFFNYVYQVDDKGMSRYMYDLQKDSAEENMNDELLRAWLKFTGKGYNSLVELANAEKEVKKLKLTKATATKKTIKVTKNDNKQDAQKIDFGYYS